MKLEWRLASRYLSTRSASRFLNLSTLIAIGGVCVGVMALIVVIGVMSGLQSEIRDVYYRVMASKKKPRAPR